MKGSDTHANWVGKSFLAVAITGGGSKCKGVWTRVLCGGARDKQVRVTGDGVTQVCGERCV